MAVLVEDDSGLHLHDEQEIQDFLRTTGIVLEHRGIPDHLKEILKNQELTDSDRDEILSELDDWFFEIKEKYGFHSRDLVVLHPSLRGLSKISDAFREFHFHTDNEVRYILDGSGVFGIHVGEKRFRVFVSSGDFILVPKKVAHYFTLDENRRIKAVRYFQETAGWAAHFIGNRKETYIRDKIASRSAFVVP